MSTQSKSTVTKLLAASVISGGLLISAPVQSATTVTVVQKLKKIIVEQLNAKEEDIKMDSKIREDLDADSLDMVEIAMVVEEDFDIELPDEKCQKMKTFEDLFIYIKNKKE